MYYPILSQYVGPNHRDSHGGSTEPERIGSVEIHTRPGRTNMSREERTDGWLGTTNDTAEHALGEFETIKEARAAIAADGWTEQADIDEDWPPCETWVETWTKPEALMQYWDAADWLQELSPRDVGITADTTNDELAKIADALEAEANDHRDSDCQHGVSLEGTEDYLRGMRDRLQAERDDE